MIRLDMSSRKLRVREVFIEREMLRSNLISNYFPELLFFSCLRRGCYALWEESDDYHHLLSTEKWAPLFLEKTIIEKVTFIL